MTACKRCGSAVITSRPERQSKAKFCSRRCSGLTNAPRADLARRDIKIAIAKVGSYVRIAELSRVSGYHESTVRRHARALAAEEASS